MVGAMNLCGGYKPARSKSDAYARFLSALDQTAVDRTAWRHACDSLAELFDARGAALIAEDITRHDLITPHSASLTEAFEHALKTGWHKNDLRHKAWRSYLRHGFLRDQDLISLDAMRRHPFYAEFRQFDLMWCGTLLFDIDGDIWGTTVHAGEERGAFTDADREALLQLREPLLMAVKRASLLGQGRIQSFEDLLGASRRGVVILGWSGKIMAASSCGEALLKAAGLARRGRLDHDDPGLSQRTRDLVDFALAPEKALVGGVPAPVLIPTKSGTVVSLDAIPFPRDFQSLVRNAAAILTLHVVDAADKPMKSTLIEVFGLTEREAETTNHLVEGYSLAETAAKMNISIGTVRQHLKSVFAKTGTRRQSELVLRVTRAQGQSISGISLPRVAQVNPEQTPVWAVIPFGGCATILVMQSLKLPIGEDARGGATAVFVHR
jgi:DNA-binding CsgD family transcriptional regulator